MTFQDFRHLITPCKLRVWDIKDELVMNAEPLYEGMLYEIPHDASFLSMPVFEVMPKDSVLVVFLGTRTSEMVGRR